MACWYEKIIKNCLLLLLLLSLSLSLSWSLLLLTSMRCKLQGFPYGTKPGEEERVSLPNAKYTQGNYKVGYSHSLVCVSAKTQTCLQLEDINPRPQCAWSVDIAVLAVCLLNYLCLSFCAVSQKRLILGSPNFEHTMTFTYSSLGWGQRSRSHI